MTADFIVTDEMAGERIDQIISGQYEELSRSYVQKIIKGGLVTVDGCTVKSSCRPSEGGCVSLEVPDNTVPEILPEDIPLDIVYEDSDVILVNKPKGMVVHPAAGHYTGTLVNALMYHCKDDLSGINGVLRPGIVHRIDMYTTGIIIACKNDFSHRAIAGQLREHSITRRYQAVVCGVLNEDEGIIDKPIGRSQRDRKKMAVNVPNAKPAVTHYTVLERFKDYTYIECRLETGRTHQIRVHMASIGHPVLGDAVYGPSKCPYELEGQTLHAGVLGFIHPRTGEYMEFTAPLPDYFEHLLKILPRG